MLSSEVVPHSKLPKPAPLKAFDVIAHQYGSFIAGYPWQLWGCATYKAPVKQQHADASFITFSRRLERALKSRVAYWAVLERAGSGLGADSTRRHWHFVMCTSSRKAHHLLSHATTLWERHYGKSYIRPYDVNRGGSHYIAKTFAREDSHFLIDRLDLVFNACDPDLYEAAKVDPYVPDHARHLLTGHTLTLQRNRKPFRTSNEGL